MTDEEIPIKKGKGVEYSHVPDDVRKAVQILNNPEEYADEYEWVARKLDDDAKIPVGERINAQAEYKDGNSWAVYVEWDDWEPLTAKFLVHKTLKEFGFTEFIAAGRTGKWEQEDGRLKHDENDEKVPKFGRKNAEGAYLRVSQPLYIISSWESD